MRTEEFAALVAAIYDCALDSPAWKPLATRLAGAFDAESCLLHVRDRRAGEAVILGATENLSGANAAAYAEYYHKVDVWAPRAARWGVGSAMVGADILGDREMLDSEFYRDYGRKVGTFDIAGALFGLGPELVGAVGIHRPQGASAFDDRHRDRLSLLLPHLTAALRLQRRLQTLQAGRTIAFEALETLGCGVLLLEDDGQLVFANRPAEALLRSRNGLSVVGGRLHSGDSASSATLARMLEAAGRAALGRSSRPGGVLSIPRPEGGPLSLLICPVPPDAIALTMIRSPVMVFIDDPRGRPTSHWELLRDIYGLTPAEARLAAALVEGCRLQDYADKTGISLTTAKSQLRQVFAKTGDNRQSDLVRNLVSNLVLRMRSTRFEEAEDR